MTVDDRRAYNREQKSTRREQDRLADKLATRVADKLKPVLADILRSSTDEILSAIGSLTVPVGNRAPEMSAVATTTDPKGPSSGATGNGTADKTAIFETPDADKTAPPDADISRWWTRTDEHDAAMRDGIRNARAALGRPAPRDVVDDDPGEPF